MTSVFIKRGYLHTNMLGVGWGRWPGETQEDTAIYQPRTEAWNGSFPHTSEKKQTLATLRLHAPGPEATQACSFQSFSLRDFVTAARGNSYRCMGENTGETWGGYAHNLKGLPRDYLLITKRKPVTLQSKSSKHCGPPDVLCQERYMTHGGSQSLCPEFNGEDTSDQLKLGTLSEWAGLSAAPSQSHRARKYCMV